MIETPAANLGFDKPGLMEFVCCRFLDSLVAYFQEQGRLAGLVCATVCVLLIIYIDFFLTMQFLFKNTTKDEDSFYADVVLAFYVKSALLVGSTPATNNSLQASIQSGVITPNPPP